MTKKKLLITVGAGASIDFGMPSIDSVDKLFDQEARTKYPLLADPTSNLYRYCRDAINVYYGGSPKPALRRWANFEEVLYQINLLISYVSDPLRLHGSNSLLQASPLPEVLEFGRTGKPANGDVLHGLTTTLMDALVDHFIDACARVRTTKSAEIAELGNFLNALRNVFDIGIITLNYDNLFTQALSGLHTGFDVAGKFEPMSVLTRSQWNFIYHLHGSVHFAFERVPHDLHSITWTKTPTKSEAVHAAGRNSQDSMEGTTYPISPFVAGHGKTQQIQRQPFRTYFAQVNRLVHEADSLLFLGYGFGDFHLNTAFSGVRDRLRPIVIVDYAADNQDPLPFREDTWSHNLFKTLPGNADAMTSAGNVSPADIGALKAAHELEVSNSSRYPLAVWYNGMLEACRYPNAILNHLS